MLETIISSLKNITRKPMGSRALIDEAVKKLTHSGIAFYPSSGMDTGDLYIVHEDTVPQLAGMSPEVFVHADFLCNQDYTVSFDAVLEQTGRFEIKEFFKLLLTHDANGRRDEMIASPASVNIYKLHDHGRKRTVFLFFYRGFLNEVILRDFLGENLKVPVIYSVCDGMTHGMGLARTDTVPVIFYPLLAPALGNRFIITEQNAAWVTERMGNAARIRQILGNISAILGDHTLDALCNLPDDDLAARMRSMLATGIPEFPVLTGELPEHLGQIHLDKVVKVLGVPNIL